MIDSLTARTRRDRPARRASLVALLIAALTLFPLASATVARGDADELPAFWRVAQALIAQHELSTPSNQVLEHMAGVVERRDQVSGVLSRVERALTEPWTPPALAAELRELLAAPAAARKGQRFGGLWDGVSGWLDLEPAGGDGGSDTARGGGAQGASGGDTAAARSRRVEARHALGALEEQWALVADAELVDLALLEALSELMGRAHVALTVALSGIPEARRKLIFSSPLSFREAWYRTHFPDEDATAQQSAHIDLVIDRLLRDSAYDQATALAVAEVLSRLTEPDFVRALAGRLEGVKGSGRPPEGFDKDIVEVLGGEPSRRVVLGGRKTSRYAAPAALIIDLGGKDRYERAAVVDDADMLASVVLDLSGDDRYESEGSGAAVATGGVALLFDADGDDRYSSGRLGQAAATLGVALLLDLGGDDSYDAEDYAQAHALNGVALLYDLGGDDSYSAWAFAQGGGLGRGFCALVDGEGDDSYLADGHWPDVYGDSGPDIFHGASQGYATGLRPTVPGGIAALLDLGDGEDRYQAGNFAMGGAYYFGFGLMYDDGGDDENFGSRYSQGFGVHQAAAVRWDAGGDDLYSCRSVAHAGMAWDEGVGYLLDDEGNDSYEVGDLGCAGAAQTGVAILIDGDGKDRYKTGKESQGGSGASEYHDKPSLALLIDLGGDKDKYSAPDRENNTLRAEPGVELFLDTKSKTMQAALKRLR